MERDPNGRRRVYLHPGHLHVAPQSTPAAISCILGSCVEVCLWDRKLRIGGAVHYLLPGVPGASARNSGRQGIHDLLSAMVKAGAQRENIVGKVFGGACMISELRASRIGDKNIETAHACLSEFKIVSLLDDVGGERARKVLFLTDTGDATVRLV